MKITSCMGGWLSLLIVAVSHASAQTPIRYDAAQHVWQITAGDTNHALGGNDHKALQTIYWAIGRH